MTNPSQEPETVWDRLRASLEQMQAAREQKATPSAIAKKLTERMQVLRGRMVDSSVAEESLTFLAFTKGRQRYGLQLENVLEVLTLEQLSTVPNAPVSIRGVIHWRGTILALMDMSQLFQIPETGIFDVHSCVIVEAAGKRLAVAASEVEEILSVPRGRLREAPTLSSDIDPAWVAGVSDENRLILCMEEIVKHLDQKQ